MNSLYQKLLTYFKTKKKPFHKTIFRSVGILLLSYLAWIFFRNDQLIFLIVIAAYFIYFSIFFILGFPSKLSKKDKSLLKREKINISFLHLAENIWILQNAFVLSFVLFFISLIKNHFYFTFIILFFIFIFGFLLFLYKDLLDFKLTEKKQKKQKKEKKK